MTANNVIENNNIATEEFVAGKVTILKETAAELEANMYKEYETAVEYHDFANEKLVECIGRLIGADTEEFAEIQRLYSELRTKW